MSIRPSIIYALILVATLNLSSGYAHSTASGIRIDQDTTIRLEQDRVTIEHALTLNRPAAYREVLKIDTDRDGTMSKEEQDRFFDDLHVHLGRGMEIKVDGKEFPLQPEGNVELSMPFTKTCRYTVDLPGGWRQGAEIEFHNENYLDFQGRITANIDPNPKTDLEIILGEATETTDGALLPSGPDPEQRDLLFRCRAGTGEVTTMPPLSYQPLSERQTMSVRHWAFVLLLLTLVVMLVLWAFKKAPTAERLRTPAAATVCIMVALVCLLVVYMNVNSSTRRRGTTLNEHEAKKIFQHLHRNIYQAFHEGTEEDIYDVLAQSLDGELLDEIYNEVYRAKLARDEGTTSFSIRRVKPLSSDVYSVAPRKNTFRMRHHWRVYGTVSHFKHRHTRINDYEALYTVASAGNGWRITDARIHQQQRVNPGKM